MLQSYLRAATLSWQLGSIRKDIQDLQAVEKPTSCVSVVVQMLKMRS